MRGVFTPYIPIHCMVWFTVEIVGRSLQSRTEEWHLCQGLESEGRGLPGDVSSGATCAGFTSAHLCALAIPTVTVLPHTFDGLTILCMGGQKSKILRTRTPWGRTLVQATPLAAGIPPCRHHIWLAPPPPARFMCGMCQHGGRLCAQRTEEGPLRIGSVHSACMPPALRLHRCLAWLRSTCI